jgi:type VI secretion system protein ImpJ
MKSPQRVVWSEGLLMSPQHLQQMDLYHEGSLTSRLDALDPLSWGIVRCTIDSHALASGSFKMESFAGVLPDGLGLALSTGDPELPASRPLEGHFPATQTSMDVFFGVPRERDGIANYSNDGSGRVRFRVANRSVHDLTGQAEAISVSFGQRNAVIIFGDEQRDDYECVKIAEVTRDPTGSLILSASYIAPCLRIGSSAFIIGRLKNLLGRMTARRQAIAEGLSQAGEKGSKLKFSTNDITRFLLLNAINGSIPALGYMADNGDVHPRLAYLFLTQFAGQLASFNTSKDPAAFPKFVYTDLRSTFEPLFRTIEELLQSTVQDNYVSVLLNSRADGMHLGQLSDDRFLSCDRFFLSVESDLTDQDLSSYLTKVSKVASWSDITGLLNAATPGAPTELKVQVPGEIPRRAGRVYFAIRTDNHYWRNVVTERNVSVWLPKEKFNPENTKLELLAIPRSS